MMDARIRFAFLGVMALVSACGAKRGLEPPHGQLPPKPATANEAPNFQQMMTLPPQAAPDRVNDPLTKSQDRPDDPFDLPPPG